MACQECDKNHLFICPSESRTSLFLDNVTELVLWMAHNNNTDPELTYWPAKYIQGHGKLAFANLGPMSDSMLEVARSQDWIGWWNMMEGRVLFNILIWQLHTHAPMVMTGCEASSFISFIFCSHSGYSGTLPSMTSSANIDG